MVSSVDYHFSVFHRMKAEARFCVIEFAYQFNQNGSWIWVQSLVFYYCYVLYAYAYT